MNALFPCAHVDTFAHLHSLLVAPYHREFQRQRPVPQRLREKHPTVLTEKKGVRLSEDAGTVPLGQGAVCEVRLHVVIKLFPLLNLLLEGVYISRLTRSPRMFRPPAVCCLGIARVFLT